MKKYVVSYPHLGSYYIPVYNFLNNILEGSNAEIMIPKKMSRVTSEYGEKNSPDYVCTPFKYNMGNFIESLEAGANVLVQAGGGCRYGYYAEVQEKILRDMGYDFKYIVLFDCDGIHAKKTYNEFKEINPNLKFSYFISRFLLTMKMIVILDKFETYVRDNLAFEKNKGELKKLSKEFLGKLKFVKNNLELNSIKKEYFKKLYSVKLKSEAERESILKVGIIGELYTSMEPYSSYFLEEELAKMGVQVKRYTTATYLLLKKGFEEKKLLKKSKGYITYALGADGTESVAHALELIDKGYDGIIHIKPFGCTPEINAMPMLQKISNDKSVPIIYFTFDMQSSEVGIKTRLEAFYDMLKMKKDFENASSINEKEMEVNG